MSLIPPGEYAWKYPTTVVLPAATLILAVTPYISRIMRGSMVEVLESDYVTMARLKGLPDRTVIWRHAVPNAIVPGDPGLGARSSPRWPAAWWWSSMCSPSRASASALVAAVANRDVPVVQALALIIAAVYVVVNLAADVPRSWSRRG